MNLLLLVILFLLINLLPYASILILKLQKTNFLKSLTDKELGLCIGFITGILNSILIFLFMSNLFAIFKGVKGV